MTYSLVHVNEKQDCESYHGIRRAVLFEARGIHGYDAKHADEYLPNHHPLLLTGMNGMFRGSECCAGTKKRIIIGKLSLEGDPSPVAEDVAVSAGRRAAFWTSDAGILVYRSGTASVKFS